MGMYGRNIETQDRFNISFTNSTASINLSDNRTLKQQLAIP